MASPATAAGTVRRSEPVIPEWRFRIITVDPFLDVDGDRVKDLPHGQVVERYLLSQLPDAEVLRFQTFPRPNEAEPGETLKQEQPFNVANVKD